MTAKDQELYGLAFSVLTKAERENDIVSIAIARAVISALWAKNISKSNSLS
jgi:hypothetical protein